MNGLLNAVANSENESCAQAAADYLAGRVSGKEAIATWGGFMNACLRGNFLEAWILADNLNRRALAKMLLQKGLAETLEELGWGPRGA
jgi:hypothetical protein